MLVFRFFEPKAPDLTTGNARLYYLHQPLTSLERALQLRRRQYSHHHASSTAVRQDLLEWDSTHQIVCRFSVWAMSVLLIPICSKVKLCQRISVGDLGDIFFSPLELTHAL